MASLEPVLGAQHDATDIQDSAQKEERMSATRGNLSEYSEVESDEEEDSVFADTRGAVTESGHNAPIELAESAKGPTTNGDTKIGDV